MRRILLLSTICGLLFSCAERKKPAPIDEPHEILSPASYGAAEPWLFTDQDGITYLSWLEQTDSSCYFLYSTFRDSSWTAADTIAAGGNWFVNWADYPTMVANGKGQLIAHYLQKSAAAKFAYDVRYQVYSNKQWSQPMLLNEDSLPAEHGFVSLLPYQEGFFAAWLDGRNTGGGTEEHAEQGHGGAMSLRAATLNASGKKLQEWELDSRTCDCCQTSAAMTANGPVVVYRDRSHEEIRDIYITRFIAGDWTEPVAVHADGWKIEGCPVNGPRIDAAGDKLAVAWYTRANDSSVVHLAFSADAGAHFGNPVQLNKGSTIGRVDCAWLNDSTALASWIEADEILVCKIHPDGRKEEPIRIAATSVSRASGFPQLTKNNDRVILAWTDVKEKTIRTALMRF